MTCSSFDCVSGPLGQRLGVFNDLDRDFVEGFQGLFGIRTKRFHALCLIARQGQRRDFEVQAALVDDAEKAVVPVESIAPEHRSCGDTAQIGELIQYEVSEAVVLPSHISARSSRCDHSHSDRQGDDRSHPILISRVNETLFGFGLLG